MQIVDYINPYAYIMRLRRVMYERGWIKSYHLDIPVISVGNLTMGGTGKSPMVMLIAQYLYSKHGKRVAIISRGYKRRTKGFLLVGDGKELLVPVEDSGDEAQMFAQLMPNAIVIVDEDRVHGANNAKALGADVIVLDDGFQHLRLKRDLNILLVDGANSSVIPLGRSREPIVAARAADIIVSGDEKKDSDLRSVNSNAIRAVIRTIPTSLTTLSIGFAPLIELSGKRILALSSIANPERFYNTLRGLGADIIEKSLGDHAEYSYAIIEKILVEAKTSRAELIVTTTKDAVKSRQYFERIISPVPILILQHTLEFLSGELGFYDSIDRIL
jgi:tetraacyldisaccharide 4'-kinase